MAETPAGANPYAELDDDDLLAQCRVETMRGSGPGGQHRNKVESAVRLTHEPTGIVVTASERRPVRASAVARSSSARPTTIGSPRSRRPGSTAASSVAAVVSCPAASSFSASW